LVYIFLFWYVLPRKIWQPYILYLDGREKNLWKKSLARKTFYQIYLYIHAATCSGFRVARLGEFATIGGFKNRVVFLSGRNWPHFCKTWPGLGTLGSIFFTLIWSPWVSLTLQIKQYKFVQVRE
jgi:hypothetical protein